MSDRDKGLQLAEDVLRPNVTRLFCLQHLKRNFHVEYCTSGVSQTFTGGSTVNNKKAPPLMITCVGLVLLTRS